jgi:hypothetical protein
MGTTGLAINVTKSALCTERPASGSDRPNPSTPDGIQTWAHSTQKPSNWQLYGDDMAAETCITLRSGVTPCRAVRSVVRTSNSARRANGRTP